VAGFINRAPQSGDTVFLAVKIGKETFCGARGTLGDITDNKPWDDADRYPHVLTLENIKFCKPFKIVDVAKHDKYFGLKYMVNPTSIKDPTACRALDSAVEANLLDKAFQFDRTSEAKDEEADDSRESFPQKDENEGGKPDLSELSINIMGTFLTVNFFNESDRIRGLETLVNSNFYQLFPQYSEERTLLIPDNRMFITTGIERGGTTVPGIRSIPDALLIVFSRHAKHPIQVNLIEYEAYGERKVRSLEKSNYLNGQIIPQLMKFASTFSIVTDKQIREDTIKDWTEKIIRYVYQNKTLQERFSSWIRELKPDLSEQLVGLEIDRMLRSALRNNVKIVLVIDELSTEQRDTITNVVRAFRLENGESTQFVGYVVRLVQRISVTNQLAEYALTVQ
jgi:hypothetical protein